MKKKIIMSIVASLGLMVALVSCSGNEEEVTEVQPTSEIKQENIQKQDELIEVTETEIGEFDGQLWQYSDELLTFYNTGEKHLYGLMDSDGKVLIEPKYENLFTKDGLVLENSSADNDVFNKVSYLNPDGTVLFDNVDGYDIKDSELLVDETTILVTLDKESQKGRNFTYYGALIDKSGKLILETKDNSTYLRRSGNYIIEIQGIDKKVVSIYNSDGTPADDSVYLEENYNSDNVFETNGLYIIINTNDRDSSYAMYDYENKKELTGYDYYDYYYYHPESVGDNCLVTKRDAQENEIYVIVDAKGNEIFNITEKYKPLPLVIDDKIIVGGSENNLVVLNQDGSVYKEVDYDIIFDLNADVEAYQEGQKIGFIYDYEKITEPIYDQYTQIDENIAFATRDGKLYRLEFK